MNTSARWALAGVLTAASYAALVGTVAATAREDVVADDDTPMELVELRVEPEPVPVEVPPIEPLVAEAAPEPEAIPEPEPVAEPDPEPVEVAEVRPEPEPEPRRRREEPAPEPTPEAPAEPAPAAEPLVIGLQGSSFAGAGDGPVFASGDQVGGGRPSRVSRVGERPAGATTAGTPNGVPGGTGEADVPAPEPERRRGRRERREDRDARLASGVEREIPYPESARRDGIETDCVLRLDVDADGNVTDVTSVRCDDDAHGFEEAVRAHVLREFHFDPATEDGIAVSTQVRWVHQFRIDS